MLVYVPPYLQDDADLAAVGVKKRPTVIPGYWHVCLACDRHYNWCYPMTEAEAAAVPVAPPRILVCPKGHNEGAVFWKFEMPGWGA